MYKVSGNLNSTYGSPITEQDSKRNNGPEMPHVTTGNHRMTNIKIGNGDYVQGIRRTEADPSGQSGIPDFSSPPAHKPLRYTPGLNCDAHLESLRPIRDPAHPAFPSGDQWKKKLIPPPNSFEGSFVDADMQQFRPSPNVPVEADPWYTSRVPESQYFPANERLNGSQYANNMNSGVYEQIYPQDELSRIKMRNRRFQNSCGQEMVGGGVGGGGMGYGMAPMMPPMYGGMMMHPMMMVPPPMMQQPPPMRPAPTVNPIPQMEDLQVLDQELNMTRRSTRPFVPTTTGPEFGELERQRNILEEPIPSLPTPKNDLLTSIDQLPAPKRMPLSSKPEPGEGATKPRPEVRIADQIAIRSIVLGQSLSKGKGGGDSVAGQAAAESGAAEAPKRAPPPTPPPSIAGEE